MSVGDASALAFSHFLTDICVRVTMVKCTVNEAEPRMVDVVYARVMGMEPDAGRGGARRSYTVRRRSERGAGTTR